MIDIKIHEHTVSTVNEFLVSNEQFGDDWREEKTGLNDLLAEVKRLREQLRLAKEWVANEHLSCLSTMDIFTEYIGGDEE
jgi:hypothetical protein